MNRAKKMAKWMLEDLLFVQRLPRSCGNAALLTFDDGPDAKLTPKILDMLDAHDARACFFVVGAYARKESSLLLEILHRGHVVGNHGYSHGRADLGFRSHAEDVYRCQQTISEITGIEARVFRPPLGSVTVGGTLASRRLGAKQVLWSIEGGEWSFAKSQPAEQIAQRLAEGIRGRDVVLLHDNNEKTATILETVLPALLRRGLDLYSGARHIAGAPQASPASTRQAP